MLFSLNCLILKSRVRFAEKVGENYKNDNNIDIPFEDFTVSDFNEQLFRRQAVKDIVQNSENMKLLKVELDRISVRELENKTDDEIIGFCTVMKPLSLLSYYFKSGPDREYIHIVIQPLTLTTGKCLPTFFPLFFYFTLYGILSINLSSC